MAIDYTSNIHAALAEAKPYLSLSVDVENGAINFGAAVNVNGSEIQSWEQLSPELFSNLLATEDYSRIWFMHMDCSSEDLSEMQLEAVLQALGVTLPEGWGDASVADEEPIPQAAPVSCSLADAIQFVIDAHKRVNGRQLVVTIDGAHWSVL